MEQHPVIIVGGPTASGKSALAIDIAEAFNGTVINADSMQVYRELSMITARPAPEDEARVPHRLYGVLSAAELCSAARWRDMALEDIDLTISEGRLPIVCGGTGLYIRALMEGISPVPDIPDEVRGRVRTLHSEMGGAAFRQRLAERDPVTAERLHDGDSQRLMRAMEVIEATGTPISAFQGQKQDAPEHLRFLPIVLLPPRDWLYERCNNRFQMMIEAGALDEVRALLALDLDPNLPAMKALGVPDLAKYLSGETSLEAAISAASQGTRRYAKRQMTWFRNQLADAFFINEQYSEREFVKIRKKIHDFLLTDAT